MATKSLSLAKLRLDKFRPVEGFLLDNYSRTGTVNMDQHEEGSKQHSLAQEGEVFAQIETYDWSSDLEFQRGLQSILSSSSAGEQRGHLINRAKCFYFSKKQGMKVDFAAYCSWIEQRKKALSGPNGQNPESLGLSTHLNDAQRGSAPGSGEPPAPYPTTFSQIVELISTGQPIPGIKDIPATVLEGQASRPVANKRRKPWERSNIEG